jgi:phage shock protein C
MKPKEQIIEQPRRLTRSIEDRKIAGVCAGIADYMGWDVGLVRIAYVLLSIGSVGFPGLLVYIILWILVPEEQPAS